MRYASASWVGDPRCEARQNAKQVGALAKTRGTAGLASPRHGARPGTWVGQSLHAVHQPWCGPRRWVGRLDAVAGAV
jgi:hypothetical protein